MIYRFPGEGTPKGISLFGRLIGAPSDRNLIDIYWEAGLMVTGITTYRPNDVFGIGFAYAGISNDEAAMQEADDAPVISDYEAMLEISYAAEIAPGWVLQPDFQYFWNPGGRVSDPNNPSNPIANAAVIGVRNSITY